jgi:CO/xanthine dehydrogenase Mo-binding subunit
MLTGCIWEKVVFGKYLFADAFFWEDVVSMGVIFLHLAYVYALLQDALSPQAPLLADVPDNIVAETRYGDSEKTAQVFAHAAHVVELKIDHQRLIALTLEPRSVQAHTHEGRLNVRISSQMPSAVRAAVSDLFAIPADQIRVVVGDVGGGFGMKTGAYPEDLAVAYCAHRLQMPVKWQSERGEDFLASSHGRDIESHCAMALDKDGKTDIATGAVNLRGLSGDPLCNAYMKCESKAKRRVTLETHCMVGNTLVLKGDALVLAPSRKFD